MAQYSVLTDENIRDILSEYSITDDFTSSVLSGGSENTNYLISTEQNKYVLTISEQKTIEQADDLAHLLAYLSDHHFPSSKVIRNSKEKAVTVYNGKPVMLKGFIPGKIMNDLPLHLIEQLGATIGKLHKTDPPDYLPHIVWCGKERFHEIEAYALNAPFHLWLKDIQNYFEKYISSELPKAFIHSDVFDNNVIVDKDKTSATIMDFEEAAYYYRVFDLAMMIIGLCIKDKTVQLKKVEQLIKGYQHENNLLDIERKALQAFTVYAAAGVASWRHKQFNFTCPDPGLYDHYKIMQEIADHVKALPSFYF